MRIEVDALDRSGQGVQVSGQHVYVESGVHVITEIEVDISSGLVVVVSGQPVVEMGIDYIKSGIYPSCSGMHGQVEIPTVMKTLEPAYPVSGWWACAEESRIFTGSDAKHVRFHDDFQARQLDLQKWVITNGTPTVSGGECRIIYAEIQSRERFLYGVLSTTVWSSNWPNIAFGFGTTDYPQGGDSVVAVDSQTFRTQNVGTGATTTTNIPAAELAGSRWYDIDIVWTPSYAQLWINGQLKVTHMTNIPSSPANIYFYGTQGVLFVANASLKPYGDISLTHRGAVPVAGGYYGTSGLLDLEWRPIRVCNSGELMICSGVHVVADVEVEVSSGQHVIISGQPVTISGDHVFVESGAHVIVGSGVGVRANILDTAGNIMKVDQKVKAGVMITTPHHEIHEGDMWTAWCIQSGLADNGLLNMLVVTGSGKETHMAPDGACGGDSWFEIYEGTTVSDNGTLITPNCMNRVISGTATTLTYCGPTVTSAMHPLLIQFMPGGQKNFAIGGTIRPNTEWIFNGVSGSINYLLRIKNVTGAAKDSSIALEWYEE